MKKYNQFVRENMNIDFLHNLDDEELQEKIQDLTLDRDEINDQISFIRKILSDRDNQRSEEFAESFPKSIFDMNSDQLEFIFEHHNGLNSKRYEISSKYLGQLDGVISSGFNPDTNQFHFKIVSRHSMDDNEDEFELRSDVVNSIKFLGENLKRDENGNVVFGVLYSYREDGYRDKILYESETKIKYFHTYSRNFKSIGEILKYIVDNDNISRDMNDY